MWSHGPPCASGIKTRSAKTFSVLVLFVLFVSGCLGSNASLPSDSDSNSDLNSNSLPTSTTRNELSPTLTHVLGLASPPGDDWKDQFGREDLVDLVRELEREAQAEEKSEIIPEIMKGFLDGALLSETRVPLDSVQDTKSETAGNSSEVLRPPEYYFMSRRDEEEDGIDLDSEETGDEEEVEESPAIYLLSDAEGEGNLPEDLADLPEDIDEDVTAGVEESLRLYDDKGPNSGNGSRDEVETRQLSMYLFQGQYVSEPRLNRFIDGAFRNMGTEMRISAMDPLYFRVLPRGRVEQRNEGQALYSGGKKKGGARRRRPGKKRVGRSTNDLEDRAGESEDVVEGRGRFNIRRRKQQQKLKLQRQKRRRQRLKAKRRRAKRCRKSKRCRRNQQKQNKNTRRRRQKKKQQKKKKLRIRRRIRQNVGGGRVEGLSNVQRDADAEMQLFGNYTLIRSHMKIGPVELTMQFRTKKGIRRTGATLPFILAHTVTRVNHEGSEMVDFLLDRPHPEMIRVRGNLFPKAQNIARNIFSRLFLPDSFLVQRMREKTALALLSKPIDT